MWLRLAWYSWPSWTAHHLLTSIQQMVGSFHIHWQLDTWDDAVGSCISMSNCQVPCRAAHLPVQVCTGSWPGLRPCMCTSSEIAQRQSSPEWCCTCDHHDACKLHRQCSVLGFYDYAVCANCFKENTNPNPNPYPSGHRISALAIGSLPAGCAQGTTPPSYLTGLQGGSQLTTI